MIFLKSIHANTMVKVNAVKLHCEDLIAVKSSVVMKEGVILNHVVNVFFIKKILNAWTHKL